MSDSAPELDADQKALVAQLGIHEPETSASVYEFMMQHNLTEAAMGELLREYRSECGFSAFEWGELDRLDDQFLNWHRWERL